MNLAILLAAITIVLMFVIRSVAECYGPKTGARYFESNTTYEVDSLRKFAKGTSVEDQPGKNMNDSCTKLFKFIKLLMPDRKTDAARGYVIPVLFPLDLIFMFALGGFIALGSLTLAGSTSMPRPWYWLLLIAPALYAITDLVEDSMLARFLTWPDTIGENGVRLLQTLTWIKKKAVIFGLAQTIFMWLWTLFPMK